MSINVRLDRNFSILLSLVVLAVLSAVGADAGFLLGIAGVAAGWLIGLSLGKGLIVFMTLFGTGLGLLAGFRYCRGVYWAETKLR